MSENECPYLSYKESMSCAACTGYVCRAYGREKKLSDTELCENDYMDCVRYMDVENIEPETESGSVTDEEIDSIISEVEEDIEKEAVEEIEVEEPVEQETVEPVESVEPVEPVFIKSPCGCGEDIRLSKCPYQSTVIPEGRSSCTGLWCYADDKNIRVPKNCWNFTICTVYLMSKYKGVPYP